MPTAAPASLARFSAHVIRPDPLTWLWPQRIPHAQLTLLVGEPGTGKSLLAADLAARVTTGRPWPDLLSQSAPPPPAPAEGTAQSCASSKPHSASAAATRPSFPWEPNPFFLATPRPPGLPFHAGGAVIVSPEDHPAEVLVPRLVAAGANLGLVDVLCGRSESGSAGHYAPLLLPDDFSALRAAVCGTLVRLLVLDPLHALLSSAAQCSPAILGRLLADLAAFARYANVAILATAHLAKSARSRTLYRVRGSIALTAAARAAHLLTVDPDDPDRRILSPLKTVYGPPPPPLAFRITSLEVPNGASPSVEPAKVQSPGLGLTNGPSRSVGLANGPSLDALSPGASSAHSTAPVPLSQPAFPAELPTHSIPLECSAPRLIWESAPARSPAELLDLATESGSALSEACDWLTDFLSHGPRPAHDILSAASAVGFPRPTLLRAKRLLNIRSQKRTDSTWVWTPLSPRHDSHPPSPPPGSAGFQPA